MCYVLCLLCFVVCCYVVLCGVLIVLCVIVGVLYFIDIHQDVCYHTVMCMLQCFVSSIYYVH